MILPFWWNIAGMAYCQHGMAVGLSRLISQDGPWHFFWWWIWSWHWRSMVPAVFGAICLSCSCYDRLFLLYFHFLCHSIFIENCSSTGFICCPRLGNFFDKRMVMWGGWYTKQQINQLTDVSSRFIMPILNGNGIYCMVFYVMER